MRRTLAHTLSRASRRFACVVLTGPRRAGKTTLLRSTFPRATHVLLEDPDVVSRVRADPHAFFADLRTPAILDEVQNAPEVLSYVRTLVDRRPRQTGRWFLTGSQEAPLVRGVTESLAGRAAVFQLLPMSTAASDRVTLFRGGFPEVLARPSAADTWFRSYVQTYLERDVRAVTAVRDLATFRRFVGLVTSRTGSVLNQTDLAAPLGVSVPTIRQWLSILEITGLLLVVPPFWESFGKRLTKSPKLYLADSGLAAHLLGIESAAALERSPFLGALFEGFVASEILKKRLHTGRRAELYWFRDQQGLEVDFVVNPGDRRLLLVEAKASRTVVPDMARPLLRLARSIDRYDVELRVVSRAPTGPAGHALADGVRAVTVSELVAEV